MFLLIYITVNIKTVIL